MSFFLPYCKEKRNEYLLVERILQFVILYVCPLLRTFPYLVPLIVITVHELVVGDMPLISGLYIQRSLV